MVLVAELAVARVVVSADAEHDGALGDHAAEVVTEAARLRGASRRVVFRIEVQHDFLPPEVLEREGLSVVREQLEVRRLVPDRDHGLLVWPQAAEPFNATALARTAGRW